MKAILTYHSIDDSGSPISIGPSAFAAHRRWFTSGRVRVLPLDVILSHPDAAGDAVAVTFDDGFANCGEALGSMADEGVPTTVFVVSQHVGGQNDWGGRTHPDIPTLPLLGWPALEGLARRGVGIEAHTRRHPRLVDTPENVLQDELEGCADDLRDRLGVESTHVAYPYGAVNATVASRASKHFQSGHTTHFDVLADDVDRMQCPRLDMYYFREPGAIEAWGTPAFLRRTGWIRTRRRLRGFLAGERGS